MNELEVTRIFISESNTTNSKLDKLKVIEKYKDNTKLLQIFQYTYNTHKQYGVTSKNCLKLKSLCSTTNNYSNIFDLLDDLDKKTLSGYDAIKAVNKFVLDNKQYEDVIWCIIDRNLKTRSTITMINSVITGLIPTFDVALANSYDNKTKSKINWSDGWYISRKLDGVRCLTIINNEGDIKFLSRQGKEFLTLENLKTYIKELKLTNVVLDGEICILDGNNNEDFNSIIKEIKRKNHTIETPHYFIFDMMNLDDFNNKSSKEILTQRLSKLGNIIKESTFISVLEQKKGSEKIFQEMVEMSTKCKWEGLMLRKNTTYKGKRSNDILKFKQMLDGEYIVEDVEFDTHRIIKDGLEVEEMMLKNVLIKHKGNVVQVGSGFTQEQRLYYYNNPNEIIGKHITVQYFEESINKSGEYSLRFPVIKAIYNQLRDL